MEKVNILGINITNVSKREVLDKINEFLKGRKQSIILTPNPEIILKAVDEDEELFYILNRADFSLADGIALKFAGWFCKKNIHRIAGADIIIDILKIAQIEKSRVAIFNWSRGLSTAHEIKQAIQRKFPGLEAYVEDIERDKETPLTPLLEGGQLKPDIVFCSLGFPYQEKFIYHNLPKIPSAKIGMVVGGSFDYLTGKASRAPLVMRLIGLEWFWRLFKQPQRWKRMYHAVIIFPYKFFRWRFVHPHLYRPNVACLLYKKENEKYKILVVERASQPGHWQLPQGGTDREDLIKAGSRELVEEIGTDKFKPLASFKKLHIYKFDSFTSKYGQSYDKRKTRGYKGQKQSLFIAEFTGQDSDISVNFWEHRAWKWVEAGKFLETIAPVRIEAGKVYLEKFWEIVNKNES